MELRADLQSACRFLRLLGVLGVLAVNEEEPTAKTPRTPRGRFSVKIWVVALANFLCVKVGFT